MSAVLRAAKVMRVNRAHPGVYARFHRGDPGFLDGLWNGIKGAAAGFLGGGPLGAIAGGVGGLVAGANKGRALLPAVNVATAGAAGGLVAGALPGAGLMPWPTLPGRTAPSNGGIPGPVEWMKNQGVRFPDQANGSCPSGYHPNKSGYYTKGGYVAPGSACVKNRKRNPLNPRAASRAMARLTSAKKATRAIAKFFGEGRKKQLAITSGKSGGCGCRKR